MFQYGLLDMCANEVIKMALSKNYINIVGEISLSHQNSDIQNQNSCITIFYDTKDNLRFGR